MLSLVITPSILTPGKLLCTAGDARNYLVRLHELSWLVDHGVLWPRWAPNLSYGYGYPVFHFYGALSLYPSLLLHRLGLSQVTALQAGFWLAFVLSGWAAYIWLQSATRDERAALIGATAYLFLPYHINTAVYRLNIAELWAMVFAPLALYGLHRMAQQLDWRSLGVTALAVSALPLTSNLATIVFMPILTTYALLLLCSSPNRLTLLRRQLVSAGLAVSLAAFFSVPALVDSHLIKIERGFISSGLNVFYNFLDLRQIFQLLLTADISRVNPPLPTSLGPLVVATALIVLAISWKRLDRDSRGHAGWTVAIGAGYVFMVTCASAPAYRALPFLNVLQFPWRFLAPAALLVASLVGVATRAYLKTIAGHLAQMGLLLVIVVLVLLGWPWLYPGLGCDLPPTPTLAQAVAYQSGMIGSLSTTAEYVPITVEEIPTTSPMVEDYLNNRPVIRWDQSLLPASARTLAIQDEGLWGMWEVDTPVAFEAIYQAFMFPGWQATVDGQPVEIQLAPPHGLIRVPVPAGHHTLAVRFGSTPDRTIATTISITALLIAVGLLLAKGKATSASRPFPFVPLQTLAWIVVGGIGAALLAARVGLVDRLNWPPRVERFDGQTIQGVAHPASVAYSGGHRLLGYGLLTRPASSGGALELDLYWATTTGANFRGLVRLMDDQGTAWTEWNKTVDFPGFIGPPPPWLWGPDLYAVMRYHVDIPPGTPPGEYSLSVATFDPDTLAKHYVTQGTPLDAERTEAIVGRVTIRRQQVKAAKLAELAQLGQPIPADDALTLVRCDVTRDQASVGEPVILQPLWYAESPPAVTAFTLQLRDAAGRAALTETLPFSPRYPPSQWQPGELVRDQLEILIPASLPSGPYTWTAVVAGHEVSLGALTVNVPERLSDLPADVTSVGQTLDNFAELAGYQAGPLIAGQPFPVTLYWHAREETATSYKVFVHLLSPQGTIVAQSDAVPTAWTRPTTSWLPPEVIEDAHTLFPPGNLAPGIYGVVVGLYEPTTGWRATTPEGQDSIAIMELSPALP